MAIDSELPAERLKAIVAAFRALAPGFPTDPRQQLRLATEAVFKSWNGKRAIDYRNAAGIAHDLGTAVNIQTMVFGNMGDDSATGVAMSRNATTGEAKIEGDYLINAQGEDVVAGIRATKPLEQLAEDLPEMYDQFAAIAARLERHYREMQDMEFTVERGKLWILQTRAGKRTAQAAVRIAVDLADEGLITREEAVMRVKPDQVDFFLHPQFSAESLPRGGDGWPRASTCRRGRRWASSPSTPTWPSAGPRSTASRPSWCGPRPSPTTCTACWPPRASSPAAAGAPATPPWWPASSAGPPWSGWRNWTSTWRPAP